MKRLVRVDARSCAKHLAAINGLLGLVAGSIQLVVAFVEAISGDMGEGVRSAIGAVLAPFLSAIAGYLIGALSAWFYNAVAPKLGGVQIEVR